MADVTSTALIQIVGDNGGAKRSLAEIQAQIKAIDAGLAQTYKELEAKQDAYTAQLKRDRTADMMSQRAYEKELVTSAERLAAARKTAGAEAAKEIQKLGKEASVLSVGMVDFDAKTKAATGSVMQMRNELLGMLGPQGVMALGGAMAVMMLERIAKMAVQAAEAMAALSREAKAVGLQKTLLGSVAGGAAASDLQALRDATRGTVDDFTLLKGLNTDITKGLITSVEQMQQLGAGARMLARLTGEGTGATFTRMAQNIANPEAIGDMLGIRPQEVQRLAFAMFGESLQAMKELDEQSKLTDVSLRLLKDREREVGDVGISAADGFERLASSLHSLKDVAGGFIDWIYQMEDNRLDKGGRVPGVDDAAFGVDYPDFEQAAHDKALHGRALGQMAATRAATAARAAAARRPESEKLADLDPDAFQKRVQQTIALYRAQVRAQRLGDAGKTNLELSAMDSAIGPRLDHSRDDVDRTQLLELRSNIEAARVREQRTGNRLGAADARDKLGTARNLLALLSAQEGSGQDTASTLAQLLKQRGVVDSLAGGKFGIPAQTEALTMATRIRDAKASMPVQRAGLLLATAGDETADHGLPSEATANALRSLREQLQALSDLSPKTAREVEQLVKRINQAVDKGPEDAEKRINAKGERDADAYFRSVDRFRSRSDRLGRSLSYRSPFQRADTSGQLEDLQDETRTLKDQGMFQGDIDQYAARRRLQISRESFKPVEDAASRFATTFFDAMMHAAEGAHSLNGAIKDIAKSLTLAFASEATQQGIHMLVSALAARAGGAGGAGGAGVGASAGASVVGAVSSTASGIGTSAVAGSLMGAGGAASATGIGLPVGIALLAGGLALSLGSRLFGSRDERKQDQYEAHLRALKDARDQGLNVVNVYLPAGPVDFTTPDMKEALRAGVESLGVTRSFSRINVGSIYGGAGGG